MFLPKFLLARINIIKNILFQNKIKLQKITTCLKIIFGFFIEFKISIDSVCSKKDKLAFKLIV